MAGHVVQFTGMSHGGHRISYCLQVTAPFILSTALLPRCEWTQLISFVFVHLSGPGVDCPSASKTFVTSIPSLPLSFIYSSLLSFPSSYLSCSFLSSIESFFCAFFSLFFLSFHLYFPLHLLYS